MTGPGTSGPAPAPGRGLGRPIGVVALLALALFLAGCLIGVVSGAGLAAVLKDQYSLTGERWPSLVSNAGILVWAGTVGVCLFAGWVVDPAAPDGGRWRGFLWLAALATGLLLVDDLLSFHEAWDDLWVTVTGQPTPGWISVAELATFGAIGLVFVAWLWRYRDLVRRTELPILVLAGALFAGSIVMDQAGPVLNRIMPWSFDPYEVVEEGLKAIAIGLYAAYLARTAAAVVRIRGT